jgi:uncharacterized membrane protein
MRLLRQRFVIVALSVFIAGMLFLLISPPAQVSDEATGTISYLDSLITDASTGQYSLSRNLSAHGTFTDAYRFQPFDNTAAYSPLLYLPGSAAIRASKLLHASVPFSFYAARLANLVVFSALVGLAVFLLDGQITYILLLAFLPAALYSAASVSQDSLLIALAIVIASALTALYQSKHTRVAFACLGAALLLLTSGKLPYLPLLGLLAVPFLFPGGAKRFAQYRLLALACAGVSVLYALAWYHVAKDIRIANIMTSAHEAHMVDAQAQLRSILHHPMHFAGTLYRTNFTSFANSDLLEIFGGMFGYRNGGPVLMPSLFVFVWLLITCYSFARSTAATAVQRLPRPVVFYVLCGGAILCSILLVQLALYMQWSPVGGSYIFGLHGRYYLPLAIITVSLLPMLLRLKTVPTISIRSLAVTSLVLFIPALVLLKNYY